MAKSKVEPSRELTLLQQAARELSERMRVVKKRETQRAQLAAFLRRRPLLTRKDLIEVADTMKAKRGGAPVKSAAVDQVAAAIAKAREAKGLDQAALAKQIGRHVTTVKYWEGGNGFPAADVRGKLSKVLGLSVDALVNGAARSSS